MVVVSPVMTAYERRLGRSDTIKSYFDDKMAILDKTSLTDSDKCDALTGGLPTDYQTRLFGFDITEPDDWLQKVMRLEGQLTKVRQPNKDSTSRSHCSITHCDESLVKSPNEARSQNTFVKRDSSKVKPPFPCKYCKRTGSIQYHWHKDCPQPRDQSGQPVDTSQPIDTPNPDQDLEQNNCVSEVCSKSFVFLVSKSQSMTAKSLS